MNGSSGAGRELRDMEGRYVRGSQFPQIDVGEHIAIAPFFAETQYEQVKEDADGNDHEFEAKLKEIITKILLVLDGNERAHVGGYRPGAERFLEIVEHVARNLPEISTIVGWILSPENIESRSKEFFYKIYQAFLGLALRVVLDERLLSDNIRMLIGEGIALLRARNDISETGDLADIIEVVQMLTQNEQSSIDMGIAIGNTVEEPDLLIRTGSDEPGANRQSGMKFTTNEPLESPDGKTLKPGPLLYSTTKFWPHFFVDYFTKVLRKAQITKMTPLDLKPGADPNEIMTILNRSTGLRGKKPLHFHIAFHSGADLDALSSGFEQMADQLKSHEQCVHFQSTIDSGETIKYGFDSEEAQPAVTWHVVPYTHDFMKARYDAIIAPSRNGFIVLPRGAEPGYANIIGAESDTASIVAALMRSIDFDAKHPRRFGKESITVEEDSIAGGHDIMRFLTLRGILGAEVALDNPDIFKIAQERTKKEFAEAVGKKEITISEELLTNRWAANLFTTWMLNRSYLFKKVFLQSSKEDVTGFINYIYTSWPITHYPVSPGWEKLTEGALERAQLISEYEEFFGLYDYQISDFEGLRPDEKKRMVEVATQVMLDIIKQKNPIEVSEDVPRREIIMHFVERGPILISKLQNLSDKSGFSFAEWQENAQDYFRSHKDEWREEVTNNPLPERLKNHEEGAVDELERKYLSGKYPKEITDLMKEKLSVLEGGGETEKIEALHDLKLYMYVCDIEQSIGAGLIFMSMICADTKNYTKGEEKLKKNIKRMKDLCQRLNIYMRVANDLGDPFRPLDQQDTNIDSRKMVEEKYSEMFALQNAERPPTGKEKQLMKIHSMAELKRFIDEMKTRLDTDIAAFKKDMIEDDDTGFLRIVIALQRGIVVGKSFYDGTHYTTAGPGVVHEVLDRQYYAEPFGDIVKDTGSLDEAAAAK